MNHLSGHENAKSWIMPITITIYVLELYSPELKKYEELNYSYLFLFHSSRYNIYIYIMIFQIFVLFISG
ncbi:MAG: hypothetical protein ACI8RD_008024 [Bacillariaceae sp.]|jgi:hypothetical protein